MSNAKMSIEIISNTPAVVTITTPLLVIAAGQSEVVKFVVNAPKTPCYIDAKILLRNYETEAEEELIMFKVDID